MQTFLGEENVSHERKNHVVDVGEGIGPESPFPLRAHHLQLVAGDAGQEGGFARVEKKLDHMNRLKECLDGDKFMDNVDLAELLGVSQRTLARYREKGVIRYYCMNENGKNLYLASEIREFLKQKGKNKE